MKLPILKPSLKKIPQNKCANVIGHVCGKELDAKLFRRRIIVLHIKSNFSKFVQQIAQHGYPITLSDL